ncbi:fumarylacetoacetate hydrolase family protein [Nocardia vaccinii]|uniref:fumarylacetoacetate hydrolase family protein n=1 Tax=Nocardia vaccinii TaxID=1822 RepID=UPI000833C568|nr:fumarylacetoacetate hydrolase family protein [Nocardia vaccinii]
MRLATVRADGETYAARLEDDTAIRLDAVDVGTLLTDPAWFQRAGADGPRVAAAGLDLAPVVPRPGKIVCVGLNYRAHILEMGRELPSHPTLFAKFADALIGPNDPLLLDGSSEAPDWEAELALVVGTRVRHASPSQAEAAIAGFSVLNDVTMRDWQYRTTQWLQGKTFEASTPFGPCLVTPDELPGGTRPTVEVRCSLDGREVQRSNTADLVFDPVDLVTYVSRIVTLHPGDVIATGTPAGVGHARTPPVRLAPGSVLVTEIEGIGRTTTPVTSVHESFGTSR